VFTLENPGKGRPKGSVSKTTLILRDILDTNGINLVEQILFRIPKLEPEVQVKTLIALLPYVYPKLVSHTLETKTPEQLALESLSGDALEQEVFKVLEAKHGKIIEINPANRAQKETPKETP